MVLTEVMATDSNVTEYGGRIEPVTRNYWLQQVKRSITNKRLTLMMIRLIKKTH